MPHSIGDDEDPYFTDHVQDASPPPTHYRSTVAGFFWVLGKRRCPPSRGGSGVPEKRWLASIAERFAWGEEFREPGSDTTAFLFGTSRLPNHTGLSLGPLLLPLLEEKRLRKALGSKGRRRMAKRGETGGGTTLAFFSTCTGWRERDFRRGKQDGIGSGVEINHHILADPRAPEVWPSQNSIISVQKRREPTQLSS